MVLLMVLFNRKGTALTIKNPRKKKTETGGEAKEIRGEGIKREGERESEPA